MSPQTQFAAEPDEFVASDVRFVRRVTVGDAARRHWWLVALPVIVLVGLALLGAYERSPIYSAQARLAVGRIDSSVPANLAGFTSATQALAETYSRSVTGDKVVRSAARRLGSTPAAVRAEVSAAPIPQTPVFRVTATGASPQRAVAIANAVGDALVRRVAKESRSAPDAAATLARYRSAAARLDRRRALVDLRRREYVLARTPENRIRLTRARAKAAATKLKVQALATAYAVSSAAPGSVARVQVIQHASAATSDRYRVMQVLVFAGLLAGLAVGLALAVMRAKRVAHRALG